MWLLYELELTYRVMIDICINSPGHGKSKIDDINGSKKTHLKQKMCMKGNEESNNGSMRMNAA